jgi:hypothetical protein
MNFDTKLPADLAHIKYQEMIDEATQHRFVRSLPRQPSLPSRAWRKLVNRLH